MANRGGACSRTRNAANVICGGSVGEFVVPGWRGSQHLGIEVFDGK